MNAGIQKAETLMTGPLGATLLLPANATDGRVSLVEQALAPRALGAPVHTHRTEDEYSVVLEGTIGVEIDGKVFEANAGDVVTKPRGVPHAVWNPTYEPARFLELIVPGGFEAYFVELGEILSRRGVPDFAALGALGTRYGLEMDPTSIPRLVEQHGLRLA